MCGIEHRALDARISAVAAAVAEANATQGADSDADEEEAIIDDARGGAAAAARKRARADNDSDGGDSVGGARGIRMAAKGGSNQNRSGGGGGGGGGNRGAPTAAAALNAVGAALSSALQTMGIEAFFKGVGLTPQVAAAAGGIPQSLQWVIPLTRNTGEGTSVPTLLGFIARILRPLAAIEAAAATRYIAAKKNAAARAATARASQIWSLIPFAFLAPNDMASSLDASTITWLCASLVGSPAGGGADGAIASVGRSSCCSTVCIGSQSGFWSNHTCLYVYRF